MLPALTPPARASPGRMPVCGLPRFFPMQRPPMQVAMKRRLRLPLPHHGRVLWPPAQGCGACSGEDIASSIPGIGLAGALVADNGPDCIVVSAGVWQDVGPSGGRFGAGAARESQELQFLEQPSFSFKAVCCVGFDEVGVTNGTPEPRAHAEPGGGRKTRRPSPGRLGQVVQLRLPHCRLAFCPGLLPRRRLCRTRR